MKTKKRNVPNSTHIKYFEKIQKLVLAPKMFRKIRVLDKFLDNILKYWF